MRRRSRLARTAKRAVLPPAEQLRAEAKKILSEGGDPKAIAVANAFLAVDEMLADGYTVREGGPEPRRWPLHEAWGGKEPPENP